MNLSINLLQERLTAPISAAVTGKIDVREFAPVSGKALAEWHLVYLKSSRHTPCAVRILSDFQGYGTWKVPATF